MKKGKYKHLTDMEREEISRCLANKQPLADTARQLGRVTSTISREIYRNSGQSGYRAFGARKRAQTAASSRRAGKSKIAKNKRLRFFAPTPKLPSATSFIRKTLLEMPKWRVNSEN